MARKFLVAIDLNKNELQNARVQNLAGAPTSPETGQLYFNSADSTLYWWDGTAWVSARGGVSFSAPGSSAPGDTVDAGVSTDTVRADHRHGREGFGSPAASAVGDLSGDGAASTLARSDHRHGREGFGAVTAQTSFAAASGDGVASSLARSDHTHGTPGHDAAAHSAIPLSALAVPTGSVGLNGQKITNLATPTADGDAATKAYVDAAAQGLDIKASVRAATLTNAALTTQASRTIDGVSLSAGDRVLLKDQTAGAENGIYVVGADFSLTRTADADSNAEVTPGMFTFVEEGTQADSGWVLTTDAPITLGTTALTFAQFSGAGQITAGAGLTKTGDTLDVGAGAGISVGADSVALDATVAVRKYATDIGDGVATSYVVTHNLGTQDVTVGVRETTSPFAFVFADVEATTTDTVTVRFATAPTAAQYRLVVHG